MRALSIVAAAATLAIAAGVPASSSSSLYPPVIPGVTGADFAAHLDSPAVFLRKYRGHR